MPGVRSTTLAVLSAGVLLASGCGADNSDSDILSAGGWPGIHSDGRNSDTSEVTGSRSLTPAWNRPIGAPVVAYPSVAANGQTFITSNTSDGCNLFSYEMASGRKRFCNHLGQAVSASTPVVDGATNIYVGDDGGMNSFNEHGQTRWRTPVMGVPLSAQFTGDGNVLSVTQLGQVNIMAKQTGERVLAPYDLIPQPDFLGQPDHPFPPNDQGLSDCFGGAAGCPVANTPAIEVGTGKFYLTLWRPGTPVASLVALQYSGGKSPKITQLWSADMLAGGSATSPTLSADGKTVYVSDNQNRLIAVDASNGQTRWTYDLGYAPQGSSSVSSDGLLIPAGGKDGHLLALRDRGDHAEPAWERKDLLQLGVPAQAKGSTGYTVVRSGTDGLTLITFDTENGKTVHENPLPGAHGFTVGTAIGPKGEVLTPTFIGELFVFKP